MRLISGWNGPYVWVNLLNVGNLVLEILADNGGDLSQSLLLDTECETSECAFNAVQLRAVRASSDSASGSTGEALDVVPSNRSELSRLSDSIWPFKGTKGGAVQGKDYNSKCFNNAGATGCGTSSATGSCVCPNGCMGADGSCYSQQNKLISRDFTLSNGEWSDHKMYVQRLSVFGQMKTTSLSSSYNLGQDKFNLYELPGLFEGQKEYFLASAKWSDYVVAMQATAGTAFTLWGAYSVGLGTEHKPWSLKDIMLRICSARNKGHPDAVMIGTSVPQGGSTIWAYIHRGSYFVYGYWYPEQLIKSKILPTGGKETQSPQNLPGKGGLWIPSPPFPRGLLPDC